MQHTCPNSVTMKVLGMFLVICFTVYYIYVSTLTMCGVILCHMAQTFFLNDSNLNTDST